MWGPRGGVGGVQFNRQKTGHTLTHRSLPRAPNSYTPATWFPGPVYTIPPQIANLDPNAELVRDMADSCAAKVTIAGVGGCRHDLDPTL